jgi:hypothetical protein
MTLCPQSAFSLGTKIRAKVSAPPAGVKGTMMVTGLAGNVCANEDCKPKSKLSQIKKLSATDL